MKLLILLSFVLVACVTFSQSEENTDFIKEIHIGTNFASLYREQNELSIGEYITNNRYVNLEGVFKFHDRFSLRIPIGYGLNSLALDGKVVEGGDLKSHWFDQGPDSGPYAQDFHYQNGPILDGHSISSQVACNLRCTYPIPFHKRPQYLKYQIGLFPSFALHNWKKASLFLTVGANFGMMDEYAISEFSSFSSIKSGDTIKGWELNNQRIEYESNSYFFVRGEFLFGCDIQLSKRFTLNYEMGFAMRVRGQGEKPDRVYTNLDDAGYKLILEDLDDSEEQYYRSLSISEKVSRANFINRISLRYQIH